jgi:2-polyprenyl-6-methoxyphenol hydroxylase-like FAD-dependent oxidoreductase
MNKAGSTRPRVLIVGGSLGGLFAANILHRAGWEVRVFERVAEELSGRGAGIVTHPELFRALACAGIEVDDSIGVKVDSRVTLAADGTVLGEIDMPQILTAWSCLFRLLHSALPAGIYRNGVNAVAAVNSSDGAVITFADGSSEHGDLVIAADGIRSTLRQKLLPTVKPQYAGYIAWRGLVDERDLSQATRDALIEKFAFCLPPQEQMLGYPVAGPNNAVAAGERRFNFVWYRPADEQATLPDLLTDVTGKRFEGGIPPHCIRPDIVETMHAAAREVLAPQFEEIIRKTPQPFFQPIFDLQSPQLAFGHIALLGDAAYVARPHCGMGVTKAAGDALALADALDRTGDVQAALIEYESSRIAFGDAVVNHARHLGAYMQAQLKNQAEREMAERYRTPEAVMRETAVSTPFY